MSWWQAHHGRNVGLKGPHGYWSGRGWQGPAARREKDAVTQLGVRAAE
ncbi:hypothetical protein [Candidatus Pantoea persica]|nr:hypothetical protein [Candidatus Pantoea persica]